MVDIKEVYRVDRYVDIVWFEFRMTYNSAMVLTLTLPLFINCRQLQVLEVELTSPFTFNLKLSTLIIRAFNFCRDFLDVRTFT